MVRNATVIILFCLSWLNSYLVSKGLQPLPAVDEAGVANFITFVMTVVAMIHRNPFKKTLKAPKASEDDI